MSERKLYVKNQVYISYYKSQYHTIPPDSTERM